MEDLRRDGHAARDICRIDQLQVEGTGHTRVGRRVDSDPPSQPHLLYDWQPFNIAADGATLLMPGNTQRPDLVAEPQFLGGIGRGAAYYDRAAFREVPRGQNRFVNLGFNALRGPEFFNTDIGLFREFTWTERVRSQFRIEWFNWTNTPRFANPNGSINSADFMSVTGTNSGGREPNGDRILRVGLRLTF